MSTAPDPRTRVCGPDARPDQIDLYQRCFQQDGSQVLPWRYDQSPHGEAVSLLSYTEQGQAISGYACMPRQILHFGDEDSQVVVGQTGDVMTDPEHRGKGLFSELDRRAREEARKRGWMAQFGLPNSKSSEIFVGKLGWKGSGRIRPYTFVLANDEAARRERIRAGRLASALVPWHVWRGTMRRGMLRKSFFAKCNVVPIQRFNSEVDQVWRDCAKEWPWMMRRDSAFLNWRFIDAPSNRFRAHGVFEPSGKMQAYCVVQLPTTEERVGHVMDLLAVDKVSLAAALEAGLGHLHKAGASVARAHAIEGSWWEKTLRWSGFQAPKSADHKRVITYVLDEDAGPLAKVAEEPTSWYFTDADREDELVR